MPCSREVEITDGSWNALPLRIRFETASLFTISSTASTRPGPLFSFISYWQATARSESAILERDDVPGRDAVDVIDQRRQRGGLARTRRTADQHQAILQVSKRLDERRQTELFELRQGAADPPEHAGEATQLVEDVGAEAQALALHLVRVINVLHGLQRHHLVGGQMREQQGLDLLLVEHGGAQRGHPPDFLHEHGLSGGDD